VAEWRSGWQSNLCIAGDPLYHRGRGAAWSSESCVPEEVPLRPPSRVLAPSPKGVPSDWTSKCDSYSLGGNGIARTPPCGQTERGSQGQPKTSRRVTRFGLASRADPAPHDTDESREY